MTFVFAMLILRPILKTQYACVFLLHECFHLVVCLPVRLFPGVGAYVVLHSTCPSSLLTFCPGQTKPSVLSWADHTECSVLGRPHRVFCPGQTTPSVLSWTDNTECSVLGRPHRVFCPGQTTQSAYLRKKMYGSFVLHLYYIVSFTSVT